MKPPFVLSWPVLAAVFTAACSSGGSDTAPSFPITTTTPAVIVTFGGTVPVGGSDAHTFTAPAGAVTVTLTAAGPPPTIVMGLGIGAPSDTACALFPGGTVNAQAGTSAQISGSVNSAGPLCVVVFDIGNQTSAVTYSVTVVHT